MLKHMATKFSAHIGLRKPAKDENPMLGVPSSSSSSSNHSHIPNMPIYDYRGSISTERTSASQEDVQEIVETRRVRLPQRPKGTYRLSDFIIQRTLGTGSFGRVHLVRSKHNLRFYAVKVLNKERIARMKQIEHTNNEQRMLQSVQHPFVINLWGVFQDAGNLYMVMDFVPGGELFTLLRRSNRFPDPVAKFYAAEVALALNHLHNEDIVYRDLKPENILLNSDGHIKIADFGFAKSCETTTWTLCGTPDYLAPEIILQQRYNKSVDWYALGVLIFEMLSGLPPYHQTEPNHMVLYERITRGPSFIRFPAAFNENATDIIMKLMEGDPSRRYGNLRHGAGDVFAHPWFREVDWDRLAARQITAPYLPRINGEGDASAYDNYPEDNAASLYGLPGPDLHGIHFPDFDYSDPSD